MLVRYSLPHRLRGNRFVISVFPADVVLRDIFMTEVIHYSRHTKNIFNTERHANKIRLMYAFCGLRLSHTGFSDCVTKKYKHVTCYKCIKKMQGILRKDALHRHSKIIIHYSRDSTTLVCEQASLRTRIGKIHWSTNDWQVTCGECLWIIKVSA